ncbi:hypothetical protein HWV62_5195 [Athelia sp. TMB]|nr:hypothetical protein HWV62_5195 [Athelia sp. TMB]
MSTHTIDLQKGERCRDVFKPADWLQGLSLGSDPIISYDTGCKKSVIQRRYFEDAEAVERFWASLSAAHAHQETTGAEKDGAE